MKSCKTILLASVPMIGAGLTFGLAAWTLAQQSVPSQQPSTQPATPPNPQNPTPHPQPVQPGQPSQAPHTDPAAIPPVPTGTPIQPSSSGNAATSANPAANPQALSTPTKAARPFMFQSPEAEARFAESSKRLTGMEQRLDQSNQDLLKRLGQIRSLSGERQNAALLDLLQQMLRDNVDMHRYLVQSRMTWSGDETMATPEGAATTTTPGQLSQPIQPAQPASPAATPPPSTPHP